MIFLLDTSDPMDEAAAELACESGQLITPLTRRRDMGVRYGIDNGAFASFDPAGFLSLLKRQEGAKERCLFVAAPDVVGSARRTLEVFERWEERLVGWPVAFVAQDGIEDLELPWDPIKAVFIGGSTGWKDSMDAMAVAKAARALGKWVHVGRVNTPGRFERWLEVADSCDGTGVSRYSHMRKRLTEAPPMFAGARIDALVGGEGASTPSAHAP